MLLTILYFVFRLNSKESLLRRNKSIGVISSLSRFFCWLSICYYMLSILCLYIFIINVTFNIFYIIKIEIILDLVNLSIEIWLYPVNPSTGNLNRYTQQKLRPFYTLLTFFCLNKINGCKNWNLRGEKLYNNQNSLIFFYLTKITKYQNRNNLQNTLRTINIANEAITTEA